MGALSNLWNCPYIDLKVKHSFFVAIPLNLLLWGCEAWALKEASLVKLDAFMHKSIRRILGISMQQVQDERLKNETVRKRFFNIPSTREVIAIRQSSFIGKILRHPNPTHPPKQLLPAWVNNKRPVGPPITTNKKSFLKSITMLYSANSKTDPFKGAVSPIDKKGSFEFWLDDALDEKKWLNTGIDV